MNTLSSIYHDKINSIKVYCFFLILACFTSYSLPVIINDTGDWKGEIQAEEVGFLVYNVGLWTQYGANFHPGEYILSFADDFSPVITNEGINYVTCTYDQVGWIWPYGGPTVSDTIAFETRKLIISKTEILQTSDCVIASLDLTGIKPASAFPSNGIFYFSQAIRVFNPIILGISERANYMGNGISVASFFMAPPYSLGAGCAAAVLSALSGIIDTVATIKQIDFSGAYAPAPADIPTGSQTWRVVGTFTADVWRTNILMYDDSDNDGFVANGATTMKYIPYYKNTARRYQFEKWD